MKPSKNLAFSLWSAAIVLCVVLSIFSLCFSACAKPSESSNSGSSGHTAETEAPANTPAQQTAAPPVDETGGDDPAVSTEAPQETETPVTPAVASVRLGETADAGREYLDKIVFLGDSTTYGIGYYYDRGYTELCPPSQIWTPASGTLTLSYYDIATIVYPDTGEELTIAEAAARAKPEIMMITLGVNGISFMDEAWFIRDYTALVTSIQQASPDTKIILNSIYPIALSYQYYDSINNERVLAANGWIERIAEDTGCRFLNSHEYLVNSDGVLPETSHNGDGLHLSGESFTTVMQYIRTHAYQ